MPLQNVSNGFPVSVVSPLLFPWVSHGSPIGVSLGSPLGSHWDPICCPWGLRLMFLLSPLNFLRMPIGSLRDSPCDPLLVSTGFHFECLFDFHWAVFGIQFDSPWCPCDSHWVSLPPLWTQSGFPLHALVIPIWFQQDTPCIDMCFGFVFLNATLHSRVHHSNGALGRGTLL